MAKQSHAKLEAAQLRSWLKAAQEGVPLICRDPSTNTTGELKLPLAKSDGGGLTFTLSKSGTATWILRYRYGNKPKELTVGNFPDISLADARFIAREKRADIDRGGDPAFEKRKSKSLATLDWTVSQLIEDYRVRILVDLSASTNNNYGRSLKRIDNKIGSYPISKITPLDIVALVESIQVDWSESRMLLTTAKVLFRHAVGKKLMAINPCIGVDLVAIKGRRPVRKVRLMLNETEINLVMNAKMSPENLLTVKILLSTAVRTDELRNAKWEHLNFIDNVWSIPATKTGTSIQIPLTSQVAGWFASLKELSKNSAYVLPARKERRKNRYDGDAPINPNTLGGAIDFWLTTHKPSIRRFTPHDLRSTAKSHMRKIGISSDISEACLNHKLRGVEGVYDQHNYFSERKAALTQLSIHLEQIENGSINHKLNPFMVAMKTGIGIMKLG